jgi:hypothetical protein
LDFLPGIFVGFLSTIWLGIFVGFLGVGSFWGFWYIHGYLIRYIFFDKKGRQKIKERVLCYTRYYIIHFKN